MITPNFNFDGRCEEAIQLYQKAFGATVGCFLRYEDANPADERCMRPDEQKKLIYHAEIFIHGQRLMMCDNLDVPFQPTLSLSLVVTLPTKKDVLNAFAVMEQGATILYPPHSSSYSTCEVVLIDRFGFRWGMMTEQSA